jgi:RimJ/RimL family protein N-acetyltransferase
MPGTEASAAVGDWQNSCSTHVLRNGTEIVIRAVRPDDKERFRAAFRKLGSASIYTRFFGYKNELSEAELEQATNVDFDRVVALVATTGLAEQETIIAGARYATYEPPLKSAEVAFTVEEEYQGLGIATALLNQLVRIARAKGLSRFEAEVLPSNRPMLAVFARSGLSVRRQSTPEAVHVTLLLDAESSVAL